MVGDETVPAPDDEIPGFGFEVLFLRALKSIDEGNCRIVRSDPDRALAGRTACAAGARIDDAEGTTGCVGQVAS